MGGFDGGGNRRFNAVALVLVGIASIFLISVVDDNCYAWLARVAPAWKIVPALRITSLTVCVILCFVFGRSSLLGPIRGTRWLPILIGSGSWLCGSVIALFVFHVWTPMLPTWIDVASFLGTGLLAEELLFRGAVFSLADRVFRGGGGFPVMAIGVSSVLFGIQHFGYHGWHFSAAAVTQVGYTVAFGVLLGLLRAWSGTIWVPVIVHFANNLVTVVYRHWGH